MESGDDSHTACVKAKKLWKVRVHLKAAGNEEMNKEYGNKFGEGKTSVCHQYIFDYLTLLEDENLYPKWALKYINNSTVEEIDEMLR